MNFIPINKDKIPYHFAIRLAGETYGMEFHYNNEGDFFTVDLSRGEELFAAGEKLVFGSPLFSAYTDTRFPKAAIIPLDLAGREDDVVWANLGSSVLLYIITPEEMEDAIQAAG